MRNNLYFIFISLITIACGPQKATKEIRDDFMKIYDKYHVQGAFVLYDSQKNHYFFFNPAQCSIPYTPASTFKICNSLIGLETGVIPNESFVIPWDSISRNALWDKDHDMKTAFKNSTVWYYQELARRVGPIRMKQWLDKANYGNKDTSGGIDKFWLEGGLRISPLQQIDFLKQLYLNQLPFSPPTMNTVKMIMMIRDTLGIRLCGKTGWGFEQETEIGWFVGYVETMDNIYYFANCVQTNSEQLKVPDNAVLFDRSRKEAVYKILSALKIGRNWETAN